MAFVFIGQVNILAPIVTINFMLTYSAVDYSYFSITMSYDLQRSRRTLGRATSRTPGPLQPLILDKSASYGSNGTLLEFTKDMDQIFRPGQVETADSAKIPDPEQKKFMKLKKSRKPAKETLQDSFQLDLQQTQEPESRTSADVPPTTTEEDDRTPRDGQEQAEQSDEDQTGDQEQLVTDVPEPGTDLKHEAKTKQKVPEFEIQSLSDSFYSKLCNHWVSFIGVSAALIAGVIYRGECGSVIAGVIYRGKCSSVIAGAIYRGECGSVIAGVIYQVSSIGVSAALIAGAIYLGECGSVIAGVIYRGECSYVIAGVIYRDVIYWGECSSVIAGVIYRGECDSVIADVIYRGECDCDRWVSFIGAIVSILIMFVIQWVYALANLGVAVLLFFYIGREEAVPEQFVVTPTFAHVGMETTQLTEENADFASRGRFHHSSVISQGHFINQFN
ncbi:unnamed protein product [Ranitomeya imitator]|uniref:Uncharacterized protein n=1 Tax=Ranitomeya imitator TaxID=111125 RepID=A0ABN9MG70_9NEOB|nr:unnamed protein product [Ranitomeya imitator]